MWLMITCGALLLVAVVLTVRWRDARLTMPAPEPDGRSVAALLRVYLWLLVVGAVTGLGTALLVIGPGGRLAMRLLAATSPRAQGFTTEAREIVGDISVAGTVSFFIFGALLGGPAIVMLYVLLHRVFRGVLGGALFGLVLLVAFGSRIDPLRPDNVDFAIVGPGWLAIAVFALLAVLTGAFAAVTAARLSKVLPLPGRWALLYAPVLGLVCVPTFLVIWPVGLAVVVGALVFVVAGRYVPDLARERGTMLLAGATALVVLLLLPGFVGAVVEIARSDPL